MSKLRMIIVGLSCICIGLLLGNTGIFSSIVKAAGDLWLTSGANIYNTNTGGIGIGKSVPVSKLHVYQNDSTIGSTSGLTLEQDGTGDATTQYLLTGAQRWVTGVDNSDTDKFKIGRGSGWGLGVDLTINTVGDIGIGTNVPLSPVHIYENTSDTGSSAGLTIEQDGSGDTTTQYLLTGSQRWVSGVDNSDGDKFKIGRGIDWAADEYIVLETNGDICIGNCE